MAAFTVYADESGQFTVGTKGALGLRIVAGVVLEGTTDDHKGDLDPKFTTALEWWTGKWHAVEINNPLVLANVLRVTARAGVPDRLLYLWRTLREPGVNLPTFRYDHGWLYQILDDESERLMDRASHVVGEVYCERSGAIVLAAEHDTSPATSRYPAMAEALVEAAALWLRQVPDGPHILHPVIAAGGPGGPPDLSRFAAAPWATEVALGMPAFPAAGKSTPGVFLADLVAYHLGPRSRALHAMSPAACLGWSAAAVSRRASEALGYAGPVCLTGALAPSAVLHAALDGTQAKRSALATIHGMKATLPAGTLLGVLEGTAELVDMGVP